MVSEDGPSQRRPWLLSNKDTFNITAFYEFPGLRLEDRDIHTKEGEGSRSWLGRGRSWERGDMNRTSFGHPVGVDNGSISTTDMVIVPMPGLGVDGLSNTTDDTQAGEIVVFDPVLTKSAEKTDGLRRGGERCEGQQMHVNIFGHVYSLLEQCKTE